MTPENRIIKEAEAEIKKAQALKIRYQNTIKKYEELIVEISCKIIEAERTIKAEEKEKSFKRKCINLCKKHTYLWFDSRDCDKKDYRMLYFGCDHFQDSNGLPCYEDPYYDNNLTFSWVELYSALNEYKQLVEKKEGR